MKWYWYVLIIVLVILQHNTRSEVQSNPLYREERKEIRYKRVPQSEVWDAGSPVTCSTVKMQSPTTLATLVWRKMKEKENDDYSITR